MRSKDAGIPYKEYLTRNTLQVYVAYHVCSSYDSKITFSSKSNPHNKLIYAQIPTVQVGIV